MGTHTTLEWNGKEAGKLINEAVATGLDEAAKNIYELSQRLVPLRTGGLQETGDYKVNKRSLIARISYSTPPGKDVALAILEHEDLYPHHKGGRSAKYLKRPMVSEQKRTVEFIADAVRKATAAP